MQKGCFPSSISDDLRGNNYVDNLSLDLSTDLSLQGSLIGQERKQCPKVPPSQDSIEENLAESLEHRVEEKHHSRDGDGIELAQGTASSNESDYSDLENGASFMAEGDSEISVSLEAETLAFEAAIKEALALRTKGIPVDSILEHLGCDVTEICAKFCQIAWNLALLSKKQGFLEEASIAFDLVQAGRTRLFGFSSIATMRCIVCKAHMLRKRQLHTESEAAYRQAIEGLKNLGAIRYQLKYQIFLSGYMRNLGKTSESLYLLLQTLIEHFHSTTALIEKTRIIKLMQYMQRVHLEMNVDQNMLEVMAGISRLQQLQSQSPTVHHELIVWGEFVRLGSYYSAARMFDMADLCFAIAPPGEHPERMQERNPRRKLELARFCMELSIHSRRNKMFVESVSQLNAAFEHLLSIRGGGEYDQGQGTVLERLLIEHEPLETKILRQCLPEEKACMSDQALLKEVDSPGIQVFGRTSGERVAWLRACDVLLKCIYVWEEFQSHGKDGGGVRSLQSGAGRSLKSHKSSVASGGSTSSRRGVTYSVGSASSWVSNSGFMVP